MEERLKDNNQYTEEYAIDLENRCKKAIEEYQALDDKIAELNIEKRQLESDNKLLQSDPFLNGAIKAFNFIFEKTNNCELASKAFDSYLLGDRNSNRKSTDYDFDEIMDDLVENNKNKCYRRTKKSNTLTKRKW